MALRFLLQPLAPVLVPLVLYTLARTESVWVRPVLNDLARILRRVWLVGGTIADSVLLIEGNLRHWLGQQVLDAEQPVVRWLGAAHTFVAQLIYASTGNAIALARGVETLADDVLRRLEVPVKVTLRETRTKVRVLDRKTIAAIAAAVASIQALKHTATVTVPGEIAGDISDLRDYVNRKANALGKAISRVERRAAIGAIAAGVTWAAIRRLKLGWLRCGGVNRVGRALCGMTGLIEALFADALGAFLVTDLCAFVGGLQSAAQAAQPFLLRFVDVEDALIGCHGATKPSPIPLPGYNPTPVIDAITL